MRKTVVALALAIAWVVPRAEAQTYEMTLAGASPGGLWSLLGVGVDRAVKGSFPGSTITYQTTGGGVANVGLVEQKRAEMGLVHNAEMRLALNGAPPFRAPAKDLTALAYLYNWAPMQFLLTKEFAETHGIKSFEDIAVKKPPIRVALNRRGNIAQAVAEEMFGAIGVTADTIKSWGGTVVLAASEEQADLIRDRRIDGIFNSLFVGQRSLQEVGQSIDVVLLPVGAATIQKVSDKLGIDAYVIPAKSYAFQPAPVPTVSLGALLVVNKAMNDKDAYNLAKALVENIEQIQGIHASMKALTPQFLTQQKVLPYHPGAVKLYQERGLRPAS